MIGRRLSHFEIVGEIGSGGMGTVYRAHDLDLERMVALKTLPPSGAGQDQRRRLLEEARAASDLNHPGIVTIYEVGSDDGIDFVAMELVEGSTLAELFEGGPIVEEEVRRWARELAEALAAAHRQGILHRDLKPANIMVDRDGWIKVLDFGLAKRTPMLGHDGGDEDPTIEAVSLTAPGTVLGTPAYMSPEQAMGRPAGPRSDLFSLGCVLYEALTGERPFRGDSPVETLSAILRDHPPPPSERRKGSSRFWDAILVRLMAKDPEDRYSSADELLVDLETRARPRRVPRMLLAMVAIASLLAGGAALLLLLRSNRAGETGTAASDDFPDYHFRLLADLPGSQMQPAFDPDGDRVVYVAEDSDGVPQLWVLPISGGKPAQLTHGEEACERPFWATDGKILFGRRSGVWEIEFSGDAERLLVDGGSAPARSDDGRWLAFNRQRRPWIARGDGGDPRPLASFDANHFGYFARPAFSPSGDEIVFFWPDPDRPLGDLWVAPVPDGEPRRLTELSFLSWGTAPVWSADGRWILFTSDHGGSTNLWRVPADGGEARPVTRGAGGDYSPDLSPDMKRLVYANGRQEGRIRVYDPETGDLRTAHARRDLLVTPALSPDGTRVAYFARALRSFHLFVADLAGGEARQVTHGDDVLNTHPTWAPDGRRLYYYQQQPTVSWRRVNPDGTDDELVLQDWSWPVRIQTRISPGEDRVAYTVRDKGKLVETRIRDLASGRERVLPLALDSPQWSTDGTTIYGATWRPYRVYACAATTGACREVTSGWQVRLGSDNRSLYVLRGGPPTIWRHDLETGDEEELVTVEGYDGVDFGWGVAPDGRVVFHSQFTGDMELWLGEVAADPD